MDDFNEFLRQKGLADEFAEYQAEKIEKEKLAKEEEKARLKDEDKQRRKEFANRLQEARQKAGMKQKDVACKVKVAPPTISNYEQGRADPQIPLLIRICHALNCSADELLGLK